MPEQNDLDRRLRAVERALTDGDHDVAMLHDTAELVHRLDEVEDRLATLEECTAELDAATQAVRGYVGNVRSVNREVEERADAALAAVDRIEERLDDRLDERLDDHPESSHSRNAVGEAPSHSSTPNQRTQRRETHSSTEERPAGKRPADAGHGIEMPPPGSTDAGTQEPGDEDEDEDEDRSVIERVREAL